MANNRKSSWHHIGGEDTTATYYISGTFFVNSRTGTNQEQNIIPDTSYWWVSNMLENILDTAQTTHGIWNISSDIRNIPTYY